MPRDFELKAMNAIHRTIRKISGERWGWTIRGMQVLELSTTGRKSGLQHAVMLTSPIELDGDPVVVASRGGDDHHPAWFVNLRADPNVRVKLSRRGALRAHARILTDEERAELWPRITAHHQNYADYQSKTTRTIPLVVLESQTQR